MLHLHVNARDHVKATRLADEILPHLMHESRVVALAIREYRQAGKTNTALNLARNAANSFLGDELIQNELGLCLIGAGDKVGAIAAFNRAIDINPVLVSAYLGRARLCAGTLGAEKITAMQVIG